jgi:hypothetical protein
MVLENHALRLAQIEARIQADNIIGLGVGAHTALPVC